MLTSILIVDDCLEMVLAEAEDDQSLLAITCIAAKLSMGSPRMTAQRVLADLVENGGYAIELAVTEAQALDKLSTSQSGYYDVMLLDGGFDAVLDYLADDRESILYPDYICPISSSAERNSDMRSKIAVLNHMQLLNRDAARLFGLSKLLRFNA